MTAELTLPIAVASLAAALLIGLLIGVQREEAGGERRPGLRDFLLVSLAGGICGVLDVGWLSAAALVSVTAVFAVARLFDDSERRGGVTTELAAITVFVLALMAASWKVRFEMPLAIGTAIVVATFLEARERLHKLARETITEAEFNGTLAFVALVLVIYPLLPQGSFGPFAFFSPRQVWGFVILISSISYAGYFLEKFLGEERGLLYTSVLGGLASTTAATMHFAKMQRDAPEQTLTMWRSFAISNSVQFPRALLIVALVNTDLATVVAAPLIAMTLFGIVMAEAIRRWPHAQSTPQPVRADNPFRLLPALKFGALFTAIVFVTKASAAKLGADAFLGTSLLGGLVDVATVVAPAADLMRAGKLAAGAGGIAVLLALASNAVLKIALAAISGTLRFAMLVAAAFAMWAVVGAGTWWIALRWLKI